MLTVEPHIQGLIFDCDGTLADTMPLHYQAWQETLQLFEVAFPEKLFYGLAGVPSDQIVTILNEKFGRDLDPKAVAEHKENQFIKHLSKIQPIEPVVAIAQHYRGQLPMAVATGGTADVAFPILASIGLKDFFTTVVTANDVPTSKPAPDIFLEAARRINISASYCQVFEDSDLGLMGAEKAGMVATDIRPWHNTGS